MKRRAKGTGTIERYRGGHRALFAFTPGKREVVGEFYGPKSYVEAESALEAVLVCIVERNGGVRGTPLRVLVEKTFAQRRAQGYSSVGGEESDWKSFLSKTHLAERPVQDLSQGEVLDTILSMKGRTKRNLGQPISMSVRKKLLNIIRAALYVAKADNLIEVNILADARFADPKGREKRKKRAKRALTWSQYEALSKASKRALEVDVAIWTGCRQGELRSLHWPDVHNVEGSECTCEEHRADPHIVIRFGRPPTAAERQDPSACTTKGGEPRVVSLFGRAMTIFQTMTRTPGVRKDGRSKNPHNIVFVSRVGGYRQKGRLVGRLQWTNWKMAAGISSFRFHDLRHTFGTWAVKGLFGKPWPLEAVKEHMGHSELKTTERYADQRGGSVAQMMAETMRELGVSQQMSQQNAEKLSHLRDLNSRPTVYEGGRQPSDSTDLRPLAGLALALVDEIEREGPFIVARALELADLVLEAEYVTPVSARRRGA